MTTSDLVDEVTSRRSHAGGSRIAPHRHDRHQLIYPSSGIIAVTTDAGTWVTPPDRAIWIPAFANHGHRFYGRTEFHCVAINPALDPFNSDGPVVVAVTPLLRELIIECSLPATRPDEETSRLVAVLVDRLRRSPDAALRLPVARDPRLANACAIVVDDLSRVHSLAELGHMVGAGERTLSRLFRNEFGMTYPQWRTQARLHRALIALAEGRTVTDVATVCGWATPSAFIDVYRRAFSHSPGARA
ncbi:helix-turn-helix transcriptional regulator [Gordonia sp. TBRC 11910]|uniref:Helix-turn-helix transcriptional regulator n=1 Tax=Gordonia asplenii TaxID=2725283 RepID=A0A848KUI2_9ACTN|nr:helix-turn-helix transcriptional regulator [Gordonia asplenii]NMO01932.1 helix-turn-helix transcriptional regulator [Gordonia asplenii]